MRTIERTGQFKRDFKREITGRHGATLEADLSTLLSLLMTDRILDVRYRDHALAGDWKDFRDCHVRPDLVLIYRKAGDDRLSLVRLGSHAELGW